MKYSQLHSKWVYDWPTIIDDLEADAYGEASKFEVITVACSAGLRSFGGRFLCLPRYPAGQLTDEPLDDMEIAFGSAINLLALFPTKGNANRARQTLAAIEARAAELLT